MHMATNVVFTYRWMWYPPAGEHQLVFTSYIPIKRLDFVWVWDKCVYMHMCMCLCVSVSIFLCTSVSAHMCACVFASVHVYVCGVPNIKFVSSACMTQKAKKLKYHCMCVDACPFVCVYLCCVQYIKYKISIFAMYVGQKVQNVNFLKNS